MHGAYDNVEHMLAENRAYRAKSSRSWTSSSTIIYGPNWPEKLEAAAARKRAAAAKREASVPDSLPIAVRVYPDLKATQPERKAPQIDGDARFRLRDVAPTSAQTLTFGSYRFLVEGRCLEEGLFYADDLTAEERDCAGALCSRASRRHRSAWHSRARHPEQSRAAAAADRGLSHAALPRGVQGTRAALSHSTFPFDASRCAIGYVDSRDRFLGGFTFQFFQYRDREGQLRAHPYRPGIAVKHMDSQTRAQGLYGRRSIRTRWIRSPKVSFKPKKALRFPRPHARRANARLRTDRSRA